MSDATKFKKHFISALAERLVDEKNKSPKEAQEMAEARFKKLLDQEDEYKEKFDEWKSKQTNDSKGKRKSSAKDDEDEDDKKKSTKKKGKAPAADADGSEDGEPKPPKAKRPRRVNPDDIEPPKKRVQFHTSVHFDKNGHMYFYNRKTNESSWDLPLHDFTILFGNAVKEMGLSSGGAKAKRNNRKSKLHGYHIFVRDFKTDVEIENPNEKGKERIRLAAAAWKKLSAEEQKPWHDKAVKVNEDNAAKGDGAEKEAAPASAAAAPKDESKGKATKKGAKAAAVKADAGNDDWESW